MHAVKSNGRNLYEDILVKIQNVNALMHIMVVVLLMKLLHWIAKCIIFFQSYLTDLPEQTVETHITKTRL